MISRCCRPMTAGIPSSREVMAAWLVSPPTSARMALAMRMTAPAVLCALLFRPLLLRGGRSRVIGAFLCGSVSVLLATLFTSGALALTDEGFLHAAEVLVLAHLPVMIAEGFFTVLVVGYLTKVRPDVFITTYTKAPRRPGDGATEER